LNKNQYFIKGYLEKRALLVPLGISALGAGAGAGISALLGNDPWYGAAQGAGIPFGAYIGSNIGTIPAAGLALATYINRHGRNSATNEEEIGKRVSNILNEPLTKGLAIGGGILGAGGGGYGAYRLIKHLFDKDKRG